MSENTVINALHVIGHDTKTDICGHGFRAMACVALDESQKWSKDTNEILMSHRERNGVRDAYRASAGQNGNDAMVAGLSGRMSRRIVAPYIYARQHRDC